MANEEARKKLTIVVGLAIGLGAAAAGSFALGIPSGSAATRAGAGAATGSPSPPYVHVHPPPVFTGVLVSDCATTDFSVLQGRPGGNGENVGEVDTYYDPESRIDRLTVFDSAKGENVSFYVSVDDPACYKIPEIAGRITQDVALAAESLQVDCADALAHLAGAPLDPSEAAANMKFDPVAGQHFVDESCGVPLPSPSG